MGGESGFQLSGNAPEAYEGYVVPAFMGEWAEDLAKAARLQPGESVLDVACGTGTVTRHAASLTGPSGKTVGLDVNPGMVEAARRQAAPDGVTITFHEASATEMPFPDDTFDVIVCQQGLQFMPNRPAALSEMARVLKPSGRLALSVWRPLDRQPFHRAWQAAQRNYLGNDFVPPGAAWTLGNPEEVRQLVSEAGFHNVHIRLQILQIRYPSPEQFILGFMQSTPTASAIAALGESSRKAMVQEIVEALEPYIDDDGIAAPMECNVVTARL